MTSAEPPDWGDPACVALNLSILKRWEAPDGPHVRAAVALTVVRRAGGWNLVVIKRVSRGTNPGQWALPGGRIDPNEAPLAAALRELREETALVAREAHVVGRLDDFITDSGFMITPFVVYPPAGQRARRNPAEVHSIHHVPLARLVDDSRIRWAPSVEGGSLLQLLLRPYMVVHAPTGAIIWQFSEVALKGASTRVHALQQPVFTRI